MKLKKRTVSIVTTILCILGLTTLFLGIMHSTNRYAEKQKSNEEIEKINECKSICSELGINYYDIIWNVCKCSSKRGELKEFLINDNGSISILE